MKEKTVEIPERIIKTLWIDGYFAAFWLFVQDGATHNDAYNLVEKELDQYNLPPRYSSYESFRRGKSHYYDAKDPILRFF